MRLQRLEKVRGVGTALVTLSARSILIAGVLGASVVSAMVCFTLDRYFSVDVVSSLIHLPNDCWLDWPARVGGHCFSDYTMPVVLGMRPDPWDPYPVYLLGDWPFVNNYPAATMLPHLTFGLIGKWTGYPAVGLAAYLTTLAIAVFSPALWAARGARGTDQIVVFIVCGVASIPAWMAIDRGNSVGFFVPIGLVYLLALYRGRWRLSAIMVIAAAVVKPHFALLAIGLFAARQWRWGAVAASGAATINFAAYFLWPQRFPQTIMQSLHGMFGPGPSEGTYGNFNASFAKGLLVFPDSFKALQTGGALPTGFLAGPRSLIGYVVLIFVIVSVLAIGRRMPPIMAGTALLAAVSLFPVVSQRYYLVFALPIAALLVRDPDGLPGIGIFDRPSVVGESRRVVGACVSLAVVASIAQIPAPYSFFRVPVAAQLGVPGTHGLSAPLVDTTATLAPIFWVAACVAIIASYGRRPVASYRISSNISSSEPHYAATQAPPHSTELLSEN